MVQGTTPTFTLTLPNTIDLEEAAHVYFTMRQGSAIVTKDESDMDISATVAEVYLSQPDTVRFSRSTDAEIQLNWTYSDGSRACTNIEKISVAENLLKEVIA